MKLDFISNDELRGTLTWMSLFNAWGTYQAITLFFTSKITPGLSRWWMLWPGGNISSKRASRSSSCPFSTRRSSSEYSSKSIAVLTAKESTDLTNFYIKECIILWFLDAWMRLLTRWSQARTRWVSKIGGGRTSELGERNRAETYSLAACVMDILEDISREIVSMSSKIMISHRIVRQIDRMMESR